MRRRFRRRWVGVEHPESAGGGFGIRVVADVSRRARGEDLAIEYGNQEHRCVAEAMVAFAWGVQCRFPIERCRHDVETGGVVGWEDSCVCGLPRRDVNGPHGAFIAGTCQAYSDRDVIICRSFHPHGDAP